MRANGSKLFVVSWKSGIDKELIYWKQRITKSPKSFSAGKLDLLKKAVKRHMKDYKTSTRMFQQPKSRKSKVHRKITKLPLNVPQSEQSHLLEELVIKCEFEWKKVLYEV